MKRKASISHDEATVRELRDNPDFAAEYLRAALEDADEPSVLLIALRRIAEATSRKPRDVGHPHLFVGREENGVPHFSRSSRSGPPDGRYRLGVIYKLH